MLSLQSCLTLAIPPGSSVNGILQARILEWVAISFSRGSSWSRNQTLVSCIAGRLFTNWATKKAPKELPPLRFKLRTYRLWDWCAACCAKKAELRSSLGLPYQTAIGCRPKRGQSFQTILESQFPWAEGSFSEKGEPWAISKHFSRVVGGGTFLMIQWLRISPSTAGDMGSIPDQGN